LAKRNVDALTLKAGPTQSGVPSPSPPPQPVGGEIIPIDKISVFLSQYWILIAILVALPLMLALYKKRSALPKWFMRVMCLFKRL